MLFHPDAALANEIGPASDKVAVLLSMSQQQHSGSF